LVFSGGIGENAPEVREWICEGLGFIGIGINKKRNNSNAQVISKNKSKTAVYVIHTDEELMIAKTTSKIINHN
jgi:acetate kinase